MKAVVADGLSKDDAYVADYALRAARWLLGVGPDGDDPEIHEVARQLKWFTCARGESLCEQGQPSDALFFLASGRALALHRDDATGATRVVGEIAQGETIGEMGILTGDPRSATVVCSRDSELLSVDRPTFEQLMAKHPRIPLSVSRTVIERLRRETAQNRRTPGASSPATIAILPAGGDDGRLLGAFAAGFAVALGKHAATRHVTRALLPPALQGALEHDAADPRVVGWLNELEHTHHFVVLQGDPARSAWSERCIRQADRLLFVARSDSSHDLGALEKEAARLATDVTGAQQDLVLLHPAADRLPFGTIRWLEARDRVGRHYHVHLGTPATIERIARFVAGRAVGLALGGGGARGFAHVGVIRALREVGVPIDAVAGTSMGSIIGAECALGWSEAEMHRRNQPTFVDVNPFSGLTLPLVAAFSGRRAVRMARRLFEDVQIEDLWSPYVAVSSNMTSGNVVAHTRGSLRKYARASASVPGLLPPVPEHGELLVDGAVLNNLPADIVRDMVGTGAVIAVDVNPREGLRASEDYGESLEGWQLVWRRLNPRARPLFVPRIHDLLERMTMLGSIHQVTQSVQATADLYLHPPTDMVRLLDFRTMEAHIERGYQFARPLVVEWAKRTGYAGTATWSTG